MDASTLINEFGFPVVMAVGMGYFIYYVWAFIGLHIKPALGNMHIALIRVIDQTRMLDQDMIRLQQKVNTVLEIRENEVKNETAEPKNKKQEGIRRVD